MHGAGRRTRTNDTTGAGRDALEKHAAPVAGAIDCGRDSRRDLGGDSRASIDAGPTRTSRHAKWRVHLLRLSRQHPLPARAIVSTAARNVAGIQLETTGVATRAHRRALGFRARLEAGRSTGARRRLHLQPTHSRRSASARRRRLRRRRRHRHRRCLPTRRPTNRRPSRTDRALNESVTVTIENAVSSRCADSLAFTVGLRHRALARRRKNVDEDGVESSRTRSRRFASWMR